VCDKQFVGDLFTDGLCPSAFLSLVILNSVAISVRKTKKPFADGFTDGICAPKKKFPA
jgi:TolB-like protein